MMGFYLQKFRSGAVLEVSILGVVLLIAAGLFGRVVAQSSDAWIFEFEKPALVWLLAGYGFLASVLPGWMLLVPRGYLSTFMKLGVVFLLGVGVIVMAPTIEMPRITALPAEAGRSFQAHSSHFSLSRSLAGLSRAFTRWCPPVRRRR
jgi:carbon starvation protein